MTNAILCYIDKSYMMLYAGKGRKKSKKHLVTLSCSFVPQQRWHLTPPLEISIKKLRSHFKNRTLYPKWPAWSNMHAFIWARYDIPHVFINVRLISASCSFVCLFRPCGSATIEFNLTQARPTHTWWMEQPILNDSFILPRDLCANAAWPCPLFYA